MDEQEEHSASCTVATVKDGNKVKIVYGIDGCNAVFELKRLHYYRVRHDICNGCGKFVPIRALRESIVNSRIRHLETCTTPRFDKDLKLCFRSASALLCLAPDKMSIFVPFT